MGKTLVPGLAVAIFILVSFTTAMAGVPHQINIQGMLTDAGGNPVTSTVGVLFAIWNDPVSGDSLWSEVLPITPDPAGRFDAILGTLQPIPDSAFLNEAFLSMKVEAWPELVPRQVLVSVAYAYKAQSSDEAVTSFRSAPGSVNSEAIINGAIELVDIGQNGASPGQVLKWTGSAWIPADDEIGSGVASPWTNTDSVLFTNDAWGLMRGGANNAVFGSGARSMVNLGTACTTGVSGSDVGYATVAGGWANKASGIFSAISGGAENIASENSATVAGGFSNWATNYNSTVAGGVANLASGHSSAIGGGNENQANGATSTVGGGKWNVASGWNATIAGGQSSQATGYHSSISGGYGNSVQGFASAIGGGWYNLASDTTATIAGGGYNRARGIYSFIGGGGGLSVADSNSASGSWSTIPGGRNNTAAGNYSFAAGRRAKVLGAGSFVWADGTDLDYYSSLDNEFAVRANGGFRMNGNNSDYGAVFENMGSGDGMRAFSHSETGIYYAALWAVNYGNSPAIYGYSSSGLAGYFNGPVTVIGYLAKPGGGFRIDHPLDPADKYLNHSFVESPDMKNVYDGVVVLDANGAAWVDLPDWFSALNRDFRYQLTPIGAPGPNLYIAEEIADNRFHIAGGSAGMKVSWQVTGIRQDAWANAHRLPAEEDKPAEELGKYLYPKEHGLPESAGIMQGAAGKTTANSIGHDPGTAK